MEEYAKEGRTGTRGIPWCVTNPPIEQYKFTHAGKYILCLWVAARSELKVRNKQQMLIIMWTLSMNYLEYSMIFSTSIPLLFP
jgi:hypothetical protein